MFYYDSGRGPALLLIHGMFGDHLDWEPVLEPLAQHYRVIAIDLPGFGDSPKIAEEPSADLFVTAVTGLLDQLGIERAVVAGNSFGGQVAMSLALAHPERVKKLVLVTPGGLHRYAPDEIDAALDRLSETNLLAFTPAVHAVIFGRLFHAQGTAIQQRYIAKQDAKLTRANYPEYVQFMHRSMRLSLELCLLEQLRGLTMPVQILHGRHDPVIRLDWIESALPLFPDVQLIVYPDCGHVPQLEHPDRVVADLTST